MTTAGQIVGGRYRLLRPLGSGGMGSVWVAQHLVMGTEVALKVLWPELLRHPIAIARFKREAQAAANLRSPYVVKIFDQDLDPETGPFIVMELLDGEDLGTRLQRVVRMDLPTVSSLVTQVARGLTRAHAAGVVHRDLKPDNIFLVPDMDGPDLVKILDFGVAKADSPLAVGSGKTATGVLIGTLSYMSPEQAQGRVVDHRTDLWALGVIAFEALIGRKLFDEEAMGAVVLQICVAPIPVPSRLDPAVPVGFDDWFAKAVNRDPDKRFQTAQDLARSLALVCEPNIRLSFTGDVQTAKSGAAGSGSTAQASSKAWEQGAERQRIGRETYRISSQAGTSSQKPKKKKVIELVPSIGPEELAEVAAPREVLVKEIETESAPQYYVMEGSLTVGPVSFELLELAVEEGKVTNQALVWTKAWDSWKPIFEVLDVPTKPTKMVLEVIMDGEGLLTTIAPSCLPPEQAPKIPSFRYQSKNTLPAPVGPRADLSRNCETAARTEHSYYVSDGELTVGPVDGSLLKRGVEVGKVPATAMAWREGWSEWLPISKAMQDLAQLSPAPVERLFNRTGVQAVGANSIPPQSAPPLSAPTARRSS